MLALVLFLATHAQPALASASIPPEISKALEQGQPADVLIEYESDAVDQEASAMRSAKDRFESSAITSLRAKRYAALKNEALARLPSARLAEIDPLQDYSHLPMSFKRLRTPAALKALVALPHVRAVYANKTFRKVASTNLNLIAQPAVGAVGYAGTGSTVAVLDDGIDYTNAAFGGCTAPGTPSTCMVAVSRTFGTGTTDNSHGTNVSAIVVGVAPGARVAMLNVFSGTSAYLSNIIGAINWAVSNKSAYNIVAINMSLGDGSLNTSPCGTNNPYVTPNNNARNAGITLIASAGNDAYSNGMSLPACTPNIVSVGAVYTESYGGFTWGNNLCTDPPVAADKVACFSDSASFMTLWAPGALVTAGGITEGGTSQAAPHVAGAVAVLRAAFPSETLAGTLSRLTTSRTMITDSRNGLIKPRLDLEAAARPANDQFSARVLMSGNSGTASGTNKLASAESGEALLDGNAGGKTVWWKWTAPASGQVSLDTHGSGFDTVLAVESGAGVAGLQAIAINNDDGTAAQASGLLFQAQAGQEYAIAVDGMNGAQGNVMLNWSLNTGAKANLSASSLTGPSNPPQGSQATYSLLVSNAGPQTATHVALTFNLPTGVSAVSSSVPCTASANALNCALGSLPNGGAIGINITVQWDAAGAQALGASVSSDLPDATPGNNSASWQVTAVPPESADTPTLPQWAAIGLASLLLMVTVRAQYAG